ncbi:MAG TPA: hypothetical protein VNS32_02840 [Flavisolibacter sp.]|nr:hypothetical protein [Flavisolibacter sp.]
MKRIIVDMDNVMANISQHFRDWYAEKTGELISHESLIGKGEMEGFPNPELVKGFLYTPGFFRSVPIMKDSQEVMSELNKKHEVFIVSSALEFPQSIPEKYQWLQEHFPFIGWQQMVFCGSKSLIKGDYMIDDYLKNLDYFNGEKLLYTAPHNQLLEGYNRVNNWQEVASILLN